jgi:hypothetical protein
MTQDNTGGVPPNSDNQQTPSGAEPVEATQTESPTQPVGNVLPTVTPTPGFAPGASATSQPGPVLTPAGGPGGNGKGIKPGVLVAVIGGAAVALGALAVIVVPFASTVFGGSAGGSPFDSRPFANASGPDAAAAVTGYLEAVAASDAKAALSYLYTEPEFTSMLTDKALTASNARAPITEITVGNQKNNEYSDSVDVVAEYRLGDVATRVKYSVIQDASDEWKIKAGGLSTFPVPSNGFDVLDLTLNGLEITEEFTDLFPGSYEFATTTEYFELIGDTDFVVGEKEQLEKWVSLEGVTASLDDEGLQIFRDTIREGLEECLASTSLKAGCGLDADKEGMVDGTLSRSLAADAQAALAALEPEPFSNGPVTNIQSGFLGSRVEITGQCISNGVQSPCTTTEFVGSATVDFSTTPATLLRWY